MNERIKELEDQLDRVRFEIYDLLDWTQTLMDVDQHEFETVRDWRESVKSAKQCIESIDGILNDKNR